MEKLLWKGVKKIPKTFEKEDIARIFDQIFKSKDYWKTKGYKDWGEFLKWRDACLIATIYSLGLRPKEACCLKFSDFNFKYGLVKIDGANNKTRKDRIIPIPKTLLKFYIAYFKFSKLRFWKGSKYLFPSFQNNHISPQTLKGIFREKILKPLGLWDCPFEAKAEYRTLYKLRHSRASHILNRQIKEKGAPDIFAIANLLGHSDIRSTQVYLHTDKRYMSYLRKQIDF
jgi:site-specific recombinase XerD